MSEYRITAEELKEEHMASASRYITKFQEYAEELPDNPIRTSLNETIRELRELRDMQYWFDSGEKELAKLYDRYLPYLDEILQKYIHLQTFIRFAEVRKLRDRLASSLQTMNDTIRNIRLILPQDEIDDASYTAKAKKAKAQLDAVTLPKESGQ
ncbi:MAG: hypothetical protein K6G61_09055 [Solobacterium sp.]|nr:hypothetical protein [Solobacterium sp.]